MPTCEDSKTVNRIDRREQDYSITQHVELPVAHARNFDGAQGVGENKNLFTLSGRHDRLASAESTSLRSRWWRIVRMLLLPPALWVPRFQLREVAARLQWMGQMWWEEATRSAERELPLSTAQGQGPGTRDRGDNDQGSRTMAESAGGEAIGTRLPRRARPSRSKAFRGRRCG